MKASDNVKNRQKLRWHSKEWWRTYRVGRNTVESLNDTVKDDIELDKSSHRPMRGMAGQQFAFALLMVAANMKRIIEFEHQLYILDKRTQEGRAPQRRKQKHELLPRRRDRLNRSNCKANPDPRKAHPPSGRKPARRSEPNKHHQHPGRFTAQKRSRGVRGALARP
ncbi:hypothetical protein DEJ16_06875 [Curtobacterium sp. MCJR17_055]|uniref:hypothetical protein n=1 Tax=unclassified Curtobacterium TaxID=257496 RepID=UPI000D94C914|nr:MULTISPECIES: hypothetical protein [unclassified Curtobacterium]PYY38028.1 hypothetical protein DEI87_02630 [Curtobacterium sp. MCBD17_029]PYY57053.1 hypothetical protein DEJ16_06875 [Curtobacterium sp. MCJR17_055]PYY62031.1 hypothetical protein DEJ26_00650 [Curtobacterium sp. MCPF17_015]